MSKLLTVGAVVIGIAFVLLGIYYWMTPAGSLLTFIPGYLAGATEIHFKHGLASVILGLGLFAFAWFQSGKPSTSIEPGTAAM